MPLNMWSEANHSSWRVGGRSCSAMERKKVATASRSSAIASAYTRTPPISRPSSGAYHSEKKRSILERLADGRDVASGRGESPPSSSAGTSASGADGGVRETFWDTCGSSLPSTSPSSSAPAPCSVLELGGGDGPALPSSTSSASSLMGRTATLGLTCVSSTSPCAGLAPSPPAALDLALVAATGALRPLRSLRQQHAQRFRPSKWRCHTTMAAGVRVMTKT
mmetsp:Transcript_3798/g.12018  ORF Transcript_3798/g.12018 Transcript_3798/m.12018 type:complete len:222 (+) Transcript_3798:1301-1966(+)